MTTLDAACSFSLSALLAPTNMSAKGWLSLCRDGMALPVRRRAPVIDRLFQLVLVRAFCLPLQRSPNSDSSRSSGSSLCRGGDGGQVKILANRDVGVRGSRVLSRREHDAYRGSRKQARVRSTTESAKGGDSRACH